MSVPAATSTLPEGLIYTVKLHHLELEMQIFDIITYTIG